MDLNKVSSEIRDIIDEKQKQVSLSFVEETHTYFIKDKSGDVVTNYPSVSTVISQFYTPFPDLDNSYKKSGYDIVKQDEILKEWRGTASYATKEFNGLLALHEHYI